MRGSSCARMRIDRRSTNPKKRWSLSDAQNSPPVFCAPDAGPTTERHDNLQSNAERERAPVAGAVTTPTEQAPLAGFTELRRRARVGRCADLPFAIRSGSWLFQHLARGALRQLRPGGHLMRANLA